MIKKMPTGDAVLGIACVAIAVLLAFYLIPVDTETGLLEKVRRRWVIGDALAPTVAACVLGIAGLLLILQSSGQGQMSVKPRQRILFIMQLLSLLIVMSLVMRWFAPVLVGILLDEDYRPLRDTLPWKYAGFVTGGFILIFACICAVEKSISWRAFTIAWVVPLALALFYDLPFDDLLLPPNGDL